MHHSAHSAHPDHARHDITLIAGHAAGDLSNLDTAAAAALLSTCTTCAEVHRDLVAISSATRALPRTARAPRDFRLTAEQAERLRRGSWLRTLLRPFASARSATRPMAAAFTSLGVAGLMVAVLLPGVLGGLGGAASAPADRDSSFAGAPTHAPAAAPGNPEVDGQSVAIPGAAGAPSTDPDAVKDPADSGMFIAVGGGTETDDGAGNQGGDLKVEEGHRLADGSPMNLLVTGSLGLLLLGLALFGLRLAARRVR